jgi:ABC-2 type transport system permease protein
VFGRLVLTESRLFLREPVGAAFILAFPTVVLLVLGSAIPAFGRPTPEFGGRRGIDVYTPVMLAMTLATVAMVPLLGALSAARHRGVFRRLATTPAPAGAMLAAQVLVNVGALLVGAVLAVLAVSLAFGVTPPGNPAGLVVGFALGAVSMCALASLIASLTPSASAASGLGALVFFPMMFAAGVWTPGETMPEVVRRIADYTPLGAASQAMQDAWDGGWPSTLHLVVLAVLGVALVGAAVRWFRWE